MRPAVDLTCKQHTANYCGFTTTLIVKIIFTIHIPQLHIQKFFKSPISMFVVWGHSSLWFPRLEKQFNKVMFELISLISTKLITFLKDNYWSNVWKLFYQCRLKINTWCYTDHLCLTNCQKCFCWKKIDFINIYPSLSFFTSNLSMGDQYCG